MRILIQQCSAYENQVVTLCGWVTHHRSSGKVKFLVLRDGSGLIQTVLTPATCDAASLENFDKITQESSVELTGTVLKDTRSKNGYEVSVQSLKLVHLAQAYPISPKEHGIEFLMQNRHLWIRSQSQWACLRVRNAIIQAIHGYFQDQGFIQFDAPILTPNSCEGTSTLFETEYFEEKAYLTQSGQLYGEAGAMAFGKIYTFGPTFRAEKSKTRKHLTEFWMIEPEVAFASLADVMELGQGLIHRIIQDVIQKCPQELAILERKPEDLLQYCNPFERLHYDDAVKLLQSKGFPFEWGEDFGAPHETAIGEAFQAPVFIHHMPAAMKAFYFKHSADGKHALACDLIAPQGYGEIIGGGCREEEVTVLENRLRAHDLEPQDYSWYLDLRRYGSVPHGGFGLGLERTVAWITGLDHVRETIPFPRLIHSLKP